MQVEEATSRTAVKCVLYAQYAEAHRAQFPSEYALPDKDVLEAALQEGWSLVKELMENPSPKSDGGILHLNLFGTNLRRVHLREELSNITKAPLSEIMFVYIVCLQKGHRKEDFPKRKAGQAILCDGLRYSVDILWRLDSPLLPDNMEVALSRLRALKRRLNRVPEKEHVQKKRMEEKVRLEEHGQPVPSGRLARQSRHHASLAPRIQDSTAADTEKMYLQVKLLPDDRDVPFYTEGWVLHSLHEGLPVDAGEVRPYMLPLLTMQLRLTELMRADGVFSEIGVRKEEEKTEVNNTVFVQGIPDIASAQMIAEYFSKSGEIMVWLKFPSLWSPSQFLDKSIIEAAEKLSISRKEFVRDLLIEWAK
ncbi:hypothetical protein T02_3384, partial [Trichinella nativa]